MKIRDKKIKILMKMVNNNLAKNWNNSRKKIKRNIKMIRLQNNNLLAN